MAKKPRSQRRKKGISLGESFGHDNNGDAVDVLSEDHTVADSVATSIYDDDFFGRDEDVHEDDPHAAEANITAAASAAASRQSRLVDALAAMQDLASEKRAVVRESILKKAFRAISQFATGSLGQETVASNMNNILTAACTTGLRGGIASPAEQYASCRVLEVTAIVLGGDYDEYYEAIKDRLTRVTQTTTRATAVRGAALRALAMTNFICSSDTSTASELLNLCEAICAPEYREEMVASTLRATALDCWALLSTTVLDAYIAGKDDFQTGRGLMILPLLKQCLDHTSVELRSAAGECVALIHESRLNLGIDEDEGENASERRFRRGSWDGSEWEVLMDEVKQRVAELSVESGHHMSKKAKKEQRATFREFMATIVDDEPPEEVVTFRGGTLMLNSWKEVVQLNFCRHCLQGGFQIQLMTNSTLQAIFGADGQLLGTDTTLTPLEKRLILSKTSEASKAADRNMTKKRRVRNNVKNHFLTADGDDI